MSFSWAANTLADRFKAEWMETLFAIEGEAFDEPNPPRPFVVLNVEGGPTDTVGIAGDGLLECRQDVTVTLDVFTPTTSGRTLPVELADRAGLVLARLTLCNEEGQHPPALRTLVPSTAGPWPARGTAGWLNARCTIDGFVDFWSERHD